MDKVTRFSGLDWYSENNRTIMAVGAGGINSYVIFNLSRIGFPLWIVDPDEIDQTNVTGGQLYRTKDIGKMKVLAMLDIVREFGCTNKISPIPVHFTKETGTAPIMITGLDNMAARRTCFEVWKESLDGSDSKEDFLLIDGRLNAENFDVFCVQGTKPEDIEIYEKEWLFSDSEVKDADCTMKQTSFAAMGIASMMTACLCNWLTNRKLKTDFREVPFKQSVYLPLFRTTFAELEIV